MHESVTATRYCDCNESRAHLPACLDALSRVDCESRSEAGARQQQSAEQRTHLAMEERARMRDTIVIKIFNTLLACLKV